MAETTTVARPYARAAFEEAQSTTSLQRWSEMLQVAALVATDEDMRQALASPQLSSEQKAELFLDVCSSIYEGGILEEGRNFIKLLAENARLTALPYIADIFEQLRTEAEKTIQAQLISAFTVSDVQRDQLAESLKTRLKRDVVLECTVDESLLGGAIIRAGDLVIDGSARGQLAKLAVALRH